MATDFLGTSSSPSPTKPTTPKSSNHASPLYSQRKQNDTCFHCCNKGHWAAECPFKTPQSSQSQSQFQSPSSSETSKFPSIQCPNCHDFCVVKISRTNANPNKHFYSCSKGNCHFFKWCDQVMESESCGGGSNNSKAKRDRAQDGCPECPCGAGKCRIVSDWKGKFFVCRIEKGHGACNFRTAVDDMQRANTVIPELNEGSQVSSLSPKRKRFESPVSDNPDPISKPVGPCPRIEEIVIENNDCDDIFNMPTIQEIAMVERELEVSKEKSLQVSRLTSEAVHRRQAEFLRQISASEDSSPAGTLITGWLGRLAFPPSGCLTVPQAKPFFCCVFPSFDPIAVPKGVHAYNYGNMNDQPHGPLNARSYSSLQIPSQDSLSGVLLELSSIKNVPGIRQGRDFMGQISKKLIEVGLHVQNQLLAILESTEPHNHRSMTEAANKTFSVLRSLSVDHRSFSERVRKFISCASSLAEIEESMMAEQSGEEIVGWYDNERAKFDTISRRQAETVDAVRASDEQLKSLGEEASHLKEMLLQIEDQLRHCERENAELKTQSGKISEDMLESEKKLKEAEVAKRLHEERETERNAAKESLERARIQLRQSVFIV